MGYNETASDLEMNTQQANPRLRVNSTSSLTLSTTFQRINFNGTSPYNTNSFLTIPGQSNQSVWYDTTNQLFKFTSNTDKNYTFFISTKTSSTNLLNGLSIVLGGTINVGTLQMRCVIPRPAGSGGPVYFPLPDGDGLVDIAPVNLISPYNSVQPFAVFANQLVRDYGIGVEVKLSNALGGTNTLVSADINVFGR